MLAIKNGNITWKLTLAKIVVNIFRWNTEEISHSSSIHLIEYFLNFLNIKKFNENYYYSLNTLKSNNDKLNNLFECTTNDLLTEDLLPKGIYILKYFTIYYILMYIFTFIYDT